MNQDVYHIPALLKESIEALNIRPDGIYVDVTFGGGGHSGAILKQLGKDGRLYSFDQDEEAAANAFSDPRFTFIHGNFRFIRNFMRYYGVESVDGIMADLGVSFHHFDTAARGFTFREDAPLDMRMNRRARLSAADILNDYPEATIADILRMYGEVAKSRQMAQAIAKQRAKEKFSTVSQLIETIKPFIDSRKEKKELACVFQALRIEVNGELNALRRFLEQSAEILRPGGRLVIITYHSLEDRIVKNFMRAGNFEGKIESDIYGHTSTILKPLGSKPTVANPEEVDSNPRSRSAKLRVAEKL